MIHAEKKFLAIDLGAESGRAILGRLSGGVVRTEEVHRFANEPVSLRGTLSWDFPGIVREVRRGIERAAQAAGGRLDGIAVDSWGVDFGVLDGSGRLLALPLHYRDRRNAEILRDVLERIDRSSLFYRTGVQPLEINTLFQLAAMAADRPEVLAASATILHIADLVAYFLGARPATEVTIASTSQLLDARLRSWRDDLIAELRLPRRMFPEIVASGTVTGSLLPEIVREAGLDAPPPLIAPASHDTASAVASVPAAGDGGWAFLSSGTWSLLGVELAEPCLSEEAFGAGFTNEAGACGTTRFLGFITGLWIVQECRRQWTREGLEASYEELASMAERAPPAAAFVDPDDPAFAAPGDMPARIREACARSGQPVPEDRASLLRVVLESLARKYAETTRAIARASGVRVERLHIVGGGSRNRLLNRLTADALGLPVVVGPAEATALGNLLAQAMATGEISGLAKMREVALASTECETILPNRAR